LGEPEDAWMKSQSRPEELEEKLTAVPSDNLMVEHVTTSLLVQGAWTLGLSLLWATVESEKPPSLSRFVLRPDASLRYFSLTARLKFTLGCFVGENLFCFDVNASLTPLLLYLIFNRGKFLV
jgi:hypothetical protein